MLMYVPSALGIITHVLTPPKHSSDSWYDATAGSGSFHLKVDFKPARHESLTIDQFDLLKVIGKGSFGKVRRVQSSYLEDDLMLFS